MIDILTSFLPVTVAILIGLGIFAIIKFLKNKR